jgi:serine/threonine protein kinase
MAPQGMQVQTQLGLLIGTPLFMSPEQARGTDVDHQTDIFSFGAVLYEMLSGVSPFAAGTVSDVIAAVLTQGCFRYLLLVISLHLLLVKGTYPRF